MMATAKRKVLSARRIPPPPISSVEVHRELDLHRQELAAQNDELRRANSELIAARDRYAVLYDGAPMAYFTLDEAGAIVEANIAASALLAAPRSLLFGRRFEDVVVPALRGSFRKFQARLRAEGQPLVHETALVLGDRRLPVRVEAARVSAEPGRVLFHLCVADESERVRREVERRSFLRREAEASRRESLGMLADGVARDLETIAHGLLVQSDILALDGYDSVVARDAGKQIRVAAGRAGELSAQLTEYGGRTLVRTESLEVSGLIQSMASSLSETAIGHAAEVELVVELAADLPLVRGDRSRLRALVTSLISNAAEAIAPGAGRIVLRTSKSSSLAVGAASHRVGVLLECVDDGRGMDAHALRHALDPFFTTKPNARGLGLALAHGTARAHGGLVFVESGVGRGARICVFLPAAEHAAASSRSGVATSGKAIEQ